MVICQMSLRLRKSSTAGYHPAAAAGAQGAADLTWLEHRREKQALQAVLLREGLCRCHVAAAVQLRQLAAFARWREALGCQDRRLLRARSAWATAMRRTPWASGAASTWRHSGCCGGPWRLRLPHQPEGGPEGWEPKKRTAAQRWVLRLSD